MGVVRTVSRPSDIHHTSYGAAQESTYFLRFWSEVIQDLIQQHDICGELRHFGALSIVEAFARSDQQSQHQRYGGPDQCHPKPDSLLGIGIEVLVWQTGMDEYAEQPSAKHAHEHDHTDGDGTHARVLRPPEIWLTLRKVTTLTRR